MWLGPSPWAPYSDMRVSIAAWLFISDYGLGCLDGAWGIHEIDIAQWVNDSDNTGPIDVEGTGYLLYRYPRYAVRVDRRAHITPTVCA